MVDRNKPSQRLIEQREYDVMDESAYENFLKQNMQCFENFIRESEQKIIRELKEGNKVTIVIEDYINNQDKDI